MTRLTNSIREKMATALVRHKYAERGEALAKEDAEIFAAAYDDRYPEPVRKAMAKLQNEHPGAFKSQDYFHERARGMYVSTGNGCFGHGDCRWRTARVSRIQFFNDDKSPLSDDILNRMADFALKAKTFNEDVAAAYRKAFAALSQFSTAKRLSEAWPEAMPVIGKLITEEDRSVPVVQMASINADFGLPPTEDLAA